MNPYLNKNGLFRKDHNILVSELPWACSIHHSCPSTGAPKRRGFRWRKCRRISPCPCRGGLHGLDTPKKQLEVGASNIFKNYSQLVVSTHQKKNTHYSNCIDIFPGQPTSIVESLYPPFFGSSTDFLATIRATG